jgi:hypothetical protein
VESSVRVLQLISVIAEAAGDQLQPHLGAVAQSLPQVGLSKKGGGEVLVMGGG